MHPRLVLGGLLPLGALLLASAPAQTHAVASSAPVTRAIAVYEWTGDLAHPTAARLIPVSLFINGHLEDAGVYLAQPIPFALQPGTLYSLERSGQTLELQSADDLPTQTDDNSHRAWYGFGRLLTPAEVAAATPPQPTQIPLAITPDAADDAPPVLRHSPPANKTAHKKSDQQPGYVTPPTTPLNDDPDRPTLHRGIPATADVTPQLTTLPPDLHQAAAISDAATRAPQIFTRPWATSTERAQTLHSLEALALPPIAHYIAFNNLTPTSLATPTLTLVNEQLSAYTLTDGGPPTFIFTAESPLTTGGPVYLTLIAQPTPVGSSDEPPLHLALLSITDATHLDRTPWLRLLDAVDPDASRRASLLFELRSQTTRQFALYAVTDGEARQTLLTTPLE
jgi:hypothetical protein